MRTRPADADEPSGFRLDRFSLKVVRALTPNDKYIARAVFEDLVTLKRTGPDAIDRRFLERSNQFANSVDRLRETGVRDSHKKTEQNRGGREDHPLYRRRDRGEKQKWYTPGLRRADEHSKETSQESRPGSL